MCADVQHMPDHSQTADSVENFGQVSRRGVRLSQTAGPMCDRHAYPPENLRMAAPPHRFHPGGAESTTCVRAHRDELPRPNHTIDLMRAVLDTARSPRA